MRHGKGAYILIGLFFLLNLACGGGAAPGSNGNGDQVNGNGEAPFPAPPVARGNGGDGPLLTEISVAAASAAGPSTYIVQPDDTLFNIGQAFGTTADDIKAANNLTSDIIGPNQQLIIPDSTIGATGETGIHIVQPGDNLFQIALQYDTTVEQLSLLNNITNPDLIYEGQVLTVPNSSTGSIANVRTHLVSRGEPKSWLLT